jgi:hypothetical protein
MDRLLSITTDANRDRIKFRNVAGCEKCNHGKTATTSVAEILTLDSKMNSLIARGRIQDSWQRHLRTGGQSAVQQGLEKVINGICCPIDLEETFWLIDAGPGANAFGSGDEPNEDVMGSDLGNFDSGTELLNSIYLGNGPDVKGELFEGGDEEIYLDNKSEMASNIVHFQTARTKRDDDHS